MPETPPSQFRLSRRSKRHLKAMAVELDKPESEIVEIAITHLAATLKAGQGVQMTVDGDDPVGPNGTAKTHKRPGSATG